MDPKYFLKRYIEDTGSTWYKPDAKTYNIFKKAVARKVLVEENGYFTLPEIKKEEEKIALYTVIKLNAFCKSYPHDLIELFIGLYEKEEGITLDEWQKDAVHLGLNNNLFILTGGPGTGKTCVLKCIFFCLKNILKTEDILFTAPTGKAARRITESVGVSATTVAKALRLTSENTTPNKLNNDVVIVDEVSMLDTKTAKALFEATLNSKLILVGDVEQLPSVGYGSVLRDLIDAGVPCTKLEKTFRQASESGLFANIEQIKLGLHLGFIKRDDFKVLNASSTEEAKELMVNEFLKAVEKYGLDQVVCLTPFRKKGAACAIALNRILQDKINPRNGQNYVTYKTHEEDGFEYLIELREGDPVMQLVNAQKVANGDVGYVKEINLEKRRVIVSFTDEEVVYRPNQLGQITLSYAMSVHKSQGSEYACVITSSIEADLAMLSRNTIYTAVSRAKKECVVITEGSVAHEACKRESGYERLTRLCEEIKYQNLKLKAKLLFCQAT